MLRKTLVAAVVLGVASSAFAGQDVKSKALRPDGETVPVIHYQPMFNQTARTETVKHKQRVVPNEPVASSRGNVGVNYLIYLKGKDGSLKTVNASRTFRSGERFKLAVKAQEGSYLTVYNRDDNGELVRVYPEEGQDPVWVEAGKTIFLPDVKGEYLKFDNEPRTERLVVYADKGITAAGADISSLTPDVMDGVDCDEVADATGAMSSKGIIVSRTGDEYCNIRSKGIIWSREGDSDSPEETYSSEDSKMILELHLKHKQ